MGKFQEVGSKIGLIVDKKNDSYGNAINDTVEFLSLLWPNGIPTEAYKHVGLIVRIYDKMKRISNNPKAFNEDPYADIAGYGILGMAFSAEEQQRCKMKK